MAGDGVDLGDLAAGIPAVFAQAGPHQDRADQRRQTAHGVDGRGAGEIMEAQIHKPALGIPDPAGLDGIDDQGNDAGVDAVGQELRALGHGAGDDGRSRGAEHQVEHKGRCVGLDERPEIRENGQIRDADEAKQIILRHHQAEAQENEHHGPDAEVHQVFHDDVARVLGPGEAGLDHGKAGLHKEHKGGADQEPDAEHLGAYGLLHKFDDTV